MFVPSKRRNFFICCKKQNHLVTNGSSYSNK